jgi:acetylornithine deacetylase
MHNAPGASPLADPIDLLTRLVATRSLSGQEGPIASLLQGWLSDHGLSPRRIDDNVLVEVHGDAPGPTFLLNSHLDTVGAGAGWDADPWSPYITHDPLDPQGGPRLIGLGSGDAKASVAAMACAAVAIAHSGLARGKLLFVASVMEEVGRGGMDVIRPQLGPIDAGMIGEPTSLQAATAQAGLVVLECAAHGKSAHAARAHLGLNALTVAARDLLRLAEWRFERVHPTLGPTMVNATVIKGGDRHNVIPDLCDYTLDVRTTPAYTPEEVVSLLRARLEAEVTVRSQRLQAVETPPDGPLLKALHAAYPAALGPLVCFGSPTMSDWAHLRDIEGVKFGPGDSPRSHTANESVRLSEVTAAVEIYAQTARRYLERAY